MIKDMDGKLLEYADALRAHVLRNVDAVLKQPRSFIRYPFIDPGSVYDGNVWDWDTYWSVYGLLNLAKNMDADTHARVVEHAKGNVRNFFDHQQSDGYIPMMIEVAQWDEPYLVKKHKEGVVMNMHKPFLCQQICLISDHIGDYSWAAEHFDGLLRYFECYKRAYFNENCSLYVWADDIMIGMDNDPATFGRPKFSTANIFLNSFMVSELRAMVRICEALKKAGAARFSAEADRLADAVQAECWDERDGFFYSADVDVKTRQFDWFHKGLGVFWKTLPIKIRVWSGFLPMLAGFATENQAARLAEHMFDAQTFKSDFGITTLAKDEKMFDLSVTNNPSNWLGPIWLVSNYAAFRGLMNYGCVEQARRICEGSLTLLGRDLEQSGSLHEYYDPFNGKPIMNGGFINWNVLALNMLEELNGH